MNTKLFLQNLTINLISVIQLIGPLTEQLIATQHFLNPPFSSDLFSLFTIKTPFLINRTKGAKLQILEQLRDIYDRNDIAMILIGMPGIEKRLARYPQLYSRIGFAHEFDKLSKDGTHHILEYKWGELGLSIKLEDFSDYEAITSIIKITGGNFMLIQRFFTQIERILEINKLETITTEVVEAARDSLVIGIK